MTATELAPALRAVPGIVARNATNSNKRLRCKRTYGRKAICQPYRRIGPVF